MLHPGTGLNVDPSTSRAEDVPETATEHATFTGFVSSLIPTSLLGAITGDAILAALVVSIVFGVALNMAGEDGALLVRGIRALTDVVFRIVGWVMRLAPLGTFGALATVVAPYGAESLKQRASLIVLSTATCVVYVLVVLGTIMRACHLSLFALMRSWRPWHRTPGGRHRHPLRMLLQPGRLRGG
ncbi:cation:dicarboxylate symporter family transporter [Streptomyces rugosispiralis]|uniref:Cation:dicarboxylase symporter family transporter n=1 Tax=Streptomyces rugosispiralis TaxID=2967341 RepID=A0ABT1UQ36_9ACTN|nr:cation:dicarboxylase symporter family transporter [Streptomyces rugosispiralis]MCQ8187101.1 cation:dicarboxylase symporter family transporter [Streptomyces rugosispiralis]